MRALTISQPFASLIASGEKFVENRTWYTPYRGPLAIHAGKGTQYLTAKELREYPTSCVVAVARLVACLDIGLITFKDKIPNKRKLLAPNTTKNWSEIAIHKHCEGPWCWILEDVVKLETPVPLRGAMGLFSVSSSIEALLREHA